MSWEDQVKQKKHSLGILILQFFHEILPRSIYHKFETLLSKILKRHSEMAPDTSNFNVLSKMRPVSILEE